MPEIKPRCRFLDEVWETALVLLGRQERLHCPVTRPRLFRMILLWVVIETGFNLWLSYDEAPIRASYPILEVVIIFLLLREFSDLYNTQEQLRETFLLVSTGFAVIWSITSLPLLAFGSSGNALMASIIELVSLVAMVYVLGIGFLRAMSGASPNILIFLLAYLVIEGVASFERWLTTNWSILVY